MRAVLSEQAVARMGRVGWGVLSQVRELQEGKRVARGWMEGMTAVVLGKCSRDGLMVWCQGRELISGRNACPKNCEVTSVGSNLVAASEHRHLIRDPSTICARATHIIPSGMHEFKERKTSIPATPFKVK